jgi:hypothetical protein
MYMLLKSNEETLVYVEEGEVSFADRANSFDRIFGDVKEDDKYLCPQFGAR